MNELCDTHGRLRCGECAYVEELKEQLEIAYNEIYKIKKESNRLDKTAADDFDKLTIYKIALEYIADEENCWDNLTVKARKALEEAGP